HNQVINKEFPSVNGVFDILKYLHKLDVLYLNWIEELPEKRGGRIQSIFFILLMSYLKFSGKKIIWTLHNKKSHSDRHTMVKALLLRLLLKKSDLIITHASDGLNYIPKKTPGVYIPHPVIPRKQQNNTTHARLNDIIIWGTVNKYKGIDLFLSYLIENKLIEKYRIIIAGTVVGSELTDKLERIALEYENVSLMNRYIEKEELITLIEESKLILFCYQSESVLSSGALMDSLSFNTNIAGPDVGAFHDLAQEGLIFSFKDYNDLMMRMDDFLISKGSSPAKEKKKENFLKNNSWEVFSSRIAELIKEL
ncbi:MAG: hypothetical protein ABFS38_14515, partial [Bacteroidota bacterium]